MPAEAPENRAANDGRRGPLSEPYEPTEVLPPGADDDDDDDEEEGNDHDA